MAMISLAYLKGRLSAPGSGTSVQHIMGQRPLKPAQIAQHAFNYR
ncbi:hypothetical protein [Aquamicrobium sp. LC103]|nr:hypothetical protein [Aquamicrobium sp. LC103]